MAIFLSLPNCLCLRSNYRGINTDQYWIRFMLRCYGYEYALSEAIPETSIKTQLSPTILRIHLITYNGSTLGTQRNCKQEELIQSSCCLHWWLGS
ncbi:putative RNA-binding protein sce3 [Fusarium oxysporum f. sp. albedinis]|nr:putative RNA-binding protein sce3 [Fusarium oxysporum f. sp. albedinis]